MTSRYIKISFIAQNKFNFVTNYTAAVASPERRAFLRLAKSNLYCLRVAKRNCKDLKLQETL